MVNFEPLEGSTGKARRALIKDGEITLDADHLKLLYDRVVTIRDMQRLTYTELEALKTIHIRDEIR